MSLEKSRQFSISVTEDNLDKVYNTILKFLFKNYGGYNPVDPYFNKLFKENENTKGCGNKNPKSDLDFLYVDRTDIHIYYRNEDIVVNSNVNLIFDFDKEKMIVVNKAFKCLKSEIECRFKEVVFKHNSYDPILNLYRYLLYRTVNLPLNKDMFNYNPADEDRLYLFKHPFKEPFEFRYMNSGVISSILFIIDGITKTLSLEEDYDSIRVLKDKSILYLPKYDLEDHPFYINGKHFELR